MTFHARMARIEESNGSSRVQGQAIAHQTDGTLPLVPAGTADCRQTAAKIGARVLPHGRAGTRGIHPQRKTRVQIEGGGGLAHHFIELAGLNEATSGAVLEDSVWHPRRHPGGRGLRGWTSIGLKWRRWVLGLRTHFPGPTAKTRHCFSSSAQMGCLEWRCRPRKFRGV